MLKVDEALSCGGSPSTPEPPSPFVHRTPASMLSRKKTGTSILPTGQYMTIITTTSCTRLLERFVSRMSRSIPFFSAPHPLLMLLLSLSSSLSHYIIYLLPLSISLPLLLFFSLPLPPVLSLFLSTSFFFSPLLALLPFFLCFSFACSSLLSPSSSSPRPQLAVDASVLQSACAKACRRRQTGSKVPRDGVFVRIDDRRQR